jgi:flagellar basal body rod protein FlgC
MQIMNIAAAAIAKQTDRLQKSAQKVAKAGDPMAGQNIDPAKEAITRIEAVNITEANIKVIKTEDERQKSLLDIIA